MKLSCPVPTTWTPTQPRQCLFPAVDDTRKPQETSFTGLSAERNEGQSPSRLTGQIRINRLRQAIARVASDGCHALAKIPVGRGPCRALELSAAACPTVRQSLNETGPLSASTASAHQGAYLYEAVSSHIYTMRARTNTNHRPAHKPAHHTVLPSSGNERGGKGNDQAPANRRGHDTQLRKSA